MRDLLEEPMHEAQSLGEALPNSPDAVSVALPRWQDVIGYEEKDPRVVGAMKTGYPRFVIHRDVQAVVEAYAPGAKALPFPSKRTAEACVEFVQRKAPNSRGAKSEGWDSVWGVVTDEEGYPAAKSFWQHTGLVLSSRHARALLAKKTFSEEKEKAAREALREKVAEAYRCEPDMIFLCPSGVAAIHTALQVLRLRRPNTKTAQLGFPYVDTLKLQQEFGSGARFISDVQVSVEQLKEDLGKEALAGVVCEIPTNPLLQAPDIVSLSPWLRERGIPLVVDDVLSTPHNVDLSQRADIVVTSLTKFPVGNGEAMGGALIFQESSPLCRELVPLLKAVHEELLWPEDAEVLSFGMEDFAGRMNQHNENGLYLAEKLKAHPAVERVYYPKWEGGAAYEALMRRGGGYGAVLSFLPKNAAQWSPRIYDELEICKGPSLGTRFTLLCPFPILAHYNELDWAEACGVSRYLLRVSTGLEDKEVLWARFERVLDSLKP